MQSSAEMYEKDKIKNFLKNRLQECVKNTQRLRKKYMIAKMCYGTTITVTITCGTVIAGLSSTTIPPLGVTITHSHGSARVFYRRRRKSMEKAKIRPLATPKPLNRSSQKLAGVITSRTAPGMQNFVAIGLRVSVPQISDFAVLLG